MTYDISNEKEQKDVILPFGRGRDSTEEFFVEDIGEIDKKPVFSAIKRLGDILLSSVLILLLFIPMAIIGIIVEVTSKGSMIFKQERLGLDGKPFMIFKFRSMVADAEKDGAQWSQGDDDERITKFGRFLRKTRLDELPQLFCIFIGTMSFVGPRPERQCFYVEFEKYIHGFHQRLKVKPGLTGLAQVRGGYDLKPEEKVLIDVEYIKNRSILLDLKIIFSTFSVIINRKGAK